MPVIFNATYLFPIIFGSDFNILLRILQKQYFLQFSCTSKSQSRNRSWIFSMSTTLMSESSANFLNTKMWSSHMNTPSMFKFVLKELNSSRLRTIFLKYHRAKLQKLSRLVWRTKGSGLSTLLPLQCLKIWLNNKIAQ